MKTALIALCIQAVLGAFDNLWHHELEAKLPQKRSARFELLTHTLRELSYAVLFLALAWREWHGAWTGFIAGLIAFEIVVTLIDFVEEDKSRKLPVLERILHTIMAIGIGVVITLMAPVLLAWQALPTAVVTTNYGAISWLLTLFSVGVLLWGLRDLVATMGHYRPPEWRRAPLRLGTPRDAGAVLVTGATGFIGGHLVRALLADGHPVIVLARNHDKAFDRFGPHVRIVADLAEIASDTSLAAVINLAGAPILGFPWTRARRRLLVESRVATTRAVVALCERLDSRPRVLVSASAIGYYGIHDAAEIDETGNAQPLFQSELCAEWERAALQAAELGIRTVRVRIGLVLGSDGGALPQLARPVRFGVGAVLGTGQQFMSWIHVADLVRLLRFAMDRDDVSGVLNGTAPEPVTQRQFQLALAAQLKRRVRFRIPAWPVRLLLGEMAQLLVDGQRVIPARARAAGFSWNYPKLEEALAGLVGDARPELGDCSGIVFDATCPVCNLEVNRVRRRAERAGRHTEYVDIDSRPDVLAEFGLDQNTARRRIYAYDRDGNIRSGFEADILLWESVSGPTVWTRLLRLPGIYHVGALLYDLVAAPALYALARYRRSRRNRRENSSSR